jgi:hypothetical protein
MPSVSEKVPHGAVALPIEGGNGAGLCTWVTAGKERLLAGCRLHLLRSRRGCPASVRAYKTDGIWVMTAAVHALLLPDAKLVDHVNGDPTDNRDHNIRPASRQQNAANSLRVKRGGKLASISRGVNKTPAGSFVATINLNGKRLYLGRYAVEEEAARAYDRKAVELHGEFAVLNFPDEHPLTSAA